MSAADAPITDAIANIISVGAGRAAGALSDIVGKPVPIGVPHIETGTYRSFRRLLAEWEAVKTSVVRQAFRGDCAGLAVLFFPESTGDFIVSVAMGQEISASKLIAVRAGTLAEIGNILNNCILGTMSNALGCSLSFSLPEYREAMDGAGILDAAERRNGANPVLLATSEFRIHTGGHEGCVFSALVIENVEDLSPMVEMSFPIEKTL